jgi:hypothetical protein
MAPMPLNDHSIQPGDPIVERAYMDCAPPALPPPPPVGISVRDPCRLRLAHVVLMAGAGRRPDA